MGVIPEGEILDAEATTANETKSYTLFLATNPSFGAKVTRFCEIAKLFPKTNRNCRGNNIIIQMPA